MPGAERYGLSATRESLKSTKSLIDREKLLQNSLLYPGKPLNEIGPNFYIYVAWVHQMVDNCVNSSYRGWSLNHFVNTVGIGQAVDFESSWSWVDVESYIF